MTLLDIQLEGFGAQYVGIVSYTVIVPNRIASRLVLTQNVHWRCQPQLSTFLSLLICHLQCSWVMGNVMTVLVFK